MTCFKPLTAWRSSVPNKNGKYPLIFNYSDVDSICPSRVQVSCGQCKGCRLDRSRQNATKMILENELHEKSIFLTLTYDDEHLPEDNSLHKEHLQKFIKNLRRQINYHIDSEQKIRFFGCGEYGNLYSRPHYHVIIFGFSPPDKRLISNSSGNKLYTSPFLEKIWKKGFISFGMVTFESCAYVARYILKKITGKTADIFYGDLEKEFVLCSNRPGIGHDWIEKYYKDVLRDGYIVIRDGVKVNPPKYFMQILEKSFPDEVAEIKLKYQIQALDRLDKEVKERELLKNFDFEDFYSYWRNENITLDMIEQDYYNKYVLPIKEAVTEGRLKNLKRGYENYDY